MQIPPESQKGFKEKCIAMKKHLHLQFDEKLSLNEDGKHVRDGLSSALLLGDNLWVACDERASLERLTRVDKETFGKHKHFDLRKYLDLPAGKSEIDIEGTGYHDHYLWLVGSHSLVRKKPRKKDSPDKQMERLASVKEEPNRYMLARIPLVKDPETGEYELHKECKHPNHKHKKLEAAQLIKVGRQNKLMHLLAHDMHLKPFLDIPGKDNGFDIEGLAVDGKKIFIGLRGPVLRGWAMILEVEIEESKKHHFKFKPIGEKGAMYKKHFLHLEGMGIRELRTIKDDLLILAGPTMDLDGTISVYRWPGALKQEKPAMVHRKELQRLFDVPHGKGKTSGQDKAEGMALYDDNHVLIVFDSPTEKRREGSNRVIADVYKV